MIQEQRLSETVRDLMADKRKDHATCTNKTTSVAGISGESGQTPEEASTANRPMSYRRNVLGGAGPLCPGLLGNPSMGFRMAMASSPYIILACLDRMRKQFCLYFCWQALDLLCYQQTVKATTKHCFQHLPRSPKK